MKFLARMFTKVTGGQHFLPAPVGAPVQPVAGWPIVVDQNGERVTTRPPAATDFLARAPMEFIDGGTEPKFKADPQASREQNLQQFIAYEIRRQKNEEHLKQAVFLLSQTDDGRRLLKLAKEKEFKLVFDTNACMEAEAMGLCDYSNKKVPLAEGYSAAEVARTLKHELQHMEDIGRGLGYDITDTPQSALTLIRGLEGNARVSEAVLAAELMLGSPHGPARQFRTASLFNVLWRDLPQMAHAADQSMAFAKQGQWGQFAAKVLPAYMNEASTLALYDENYCKFVDKYVPDTTAYIQALKTMPEGNYDTRASYERYIDRVRRGVNSIFNKDRWTTEGVCSLLTIGGKVYTQHLPQNFSLNGGKAFSVRAEAKGAFERIKQQILTVVPESDKAAHMDLPSMKWKPLMPSISPYALYRTKLEQEAFVPIRMPDRIDGAMLTNKQAAYDHIGKTFTTMKDDMKSGKTEIDRINYALGSYLHQNRGTANLRGLVGDLLEAGFRAPIGAFPSEYLHDLHGRVQLAAKNGNAGNLSASEVKLLDHWQKLKDAGLDPVWLDAKQKQESWVGADKTLESYATRLSGLLTQTGDAAKSVHSSAGYKKTA